MSGLDLLWTVEKWLPVAVLFDLIVLQFALRWAYRKGKRRRAKTADLQGQRRPPGRIPRPPEEG